MKLTRAIASSSSRIDLTGTAWHRRQSAPGGINSQKALGKLEQLSLNMQAQSVCVGVDAQLLLVSTTSLWS
jgi:hypothetical protein